mmetsp:Transcript_85873/g.218890  ORF Transcript_85873/g.218890 Transcript_85873/m.218890 type:complete len:87 (+) Transcript_85873:1613-1873(+)
MPCVTAAERPNLERGAAPDRVRPEHDAERVSFTLLHSSQHLYRAYMLRLSACAERLKNLQKCCNAFSTSQFMIGCHLYSLQADFQR